MTAKKKTDKPNPEGRPTKYKPEFCELYIEHGKKGGFVEAFPAFLHEKTKVIVCQDTIYEWAKVHPEFSEAKKLGDAYCCKWWQEKAEDAAEGGVKGFPSGPWIFIAKNKFGWRDQLDLSTDPEGDAAKREKLAKLFEDPDIAAKIAVVSRKSNE